MFDKVPGAERSRANAAAGRDLVSLDEIATRASVAEESEVGGWFGRA
ncbi:hypothetical protein ACFYT4_31730 [Streptomyces sp. NPDC004609]